MGQRATAVQNFRVYDFFILTAFVGAHIMVDFFFFFVLSVGFPMAVEAVFSRWLVVGVENEEKSCRTCCVLIYFVVWYRC